MLKTGFFNKKKIILYKISMQKLDCFFLALFVLYFFVKVYKVWQNLNLPTKYCTKKCNISWDKCIKIFLNFGFVYNYKKMKIISSIHYNILIKTTIISMYFQIYCAILFIKIISNNSLILCFNEIQICFTGYMEK